MESVVKVAIGVGLTVTPHHAVTPLPGAQAQRGNANVGLAERNEIFHAALRSLALLFVGGKVQSEILRSAPLRSE